MTTLNGGSLDFRPVSPFAHLGQEAAVAYDPMAPADEVEDAGQRLVKIYGTQPDGGFAPQARELFGQMASLQMAERRAENILAKAQRLIEGREYDEGKAQIQAWSSDFGKGFFKWLPKRGIQFPVLRAFARRLEVAQAFIRTRKRQFERYARPSVSADQMGWRLTMRDEAGQATESIQEQIRWLTRVLECGGREFASVRRRELGRQGMVQFMRHMAEDTLVLDHVAVELVGLNGAHGLDSWFVRPSETFALGSRQEGRETLPDGRPVYAFQVLNGRAEIPFAFDELAIWIRNSSTWAEENGYGYSEFEQSLDTLNNIIQATTYTKQGLQDNATPRGILMMYGNYDVKTQNAFKAAWDAKVKGVQNQFGTPVLFSRGQQGGVQYVNTGQPFDEMAFGQWISFNATVMGAIFGVAPEEVGFEGFTSAGKSSLSGDDTVEKLAAAKDKGLYPLLKDAGAFITDEIVDRYGFPLRLEFTGLDTVDSDARRKEKLATMTIDEVRATLDMPRHPKPWIGAMPFDSAQQTQEWTRIQAASTYGEIRALLDKAAYPSPMVDMTPANPGLGAIYMQSLTVPPDAPEGGDDPEGGPGADPTEALSPAAARLAQLTEGGSPFQALSSLNGGDDDGGLS